jgi:hypothetical protein
MASDSPRDVAVRRRRDLERHRLAWMVNDSDDAVNHCAYVVDEFRQDERDLAGTGTGTGAADRTHGTKSLM